MKFIRAAFSVDRLIGYTLLLGFLALHFINPAPVEFARLKVFDYYQQFKPREIPLPQNKRVTIIDIDEQSLETIGQYPWPRNIMAKLIDNAMAMGAGLIAFDIVFAEPDGKDLGTVAKIAKGLSPEITKLLTSRLSNDQILANSIKKGRVVLGQAGRTSTGGTTGSTHSRHRAGGDSRKTEDSRSFARRCVLGPGIEPQSVVSPSAGQIECP